MRPVRSLAAASLLSALALAAPTTAVAAPTAGATALAAEPVRVLSWNIHNNGTPSQTLLNQIVSISPDVFFSIETYGGGPRIAQELTSRAGKGTYTGVRITDSSSDNLWIFTRYPVVQAYGNPSGAISDFNFGGARIRLTGGREVNVMDTWINYSNNPNWIGYLIDQNAHDVQAGRPVTYSPDTVRNSESTQLSQVNSVLSQLGSLTGNSTAPTIMAGDFNTVPERDWSSSFAGCGSHFGLSYALQVTARMTASGFTDTYRAAHSDACGSPGTTWLEGGLITPQRIDFVFTKGSIGVSSSSTYNGVSDHAGVVTDLSVS